MKKDGRPSNEDLDNREEEQLAQENEADDLAMETDLSEWLKENKREDEVSTFIIYKKELRQGLGTGGKRKQVWETEDEIIKKHDCGLMFGSGIYTTYLILPPRESHKKKAPPRVLKKTFILGEHYDLAHKVWLKEQGYAVPGEHNGNGNGNGNGAAEIYAGLIKDLYNPMVLKLTDKISNKNDTDLDFKKILNDSVGGMVTVFKDAAIQNIRNIQEVSKEVIVHNATAGAAAGDPTAIEGESSEWAAFMKEMIREHGKELLEAGVVKLKMFAANLKKDEMFQSLAANPPLYKRVFEHLQADPDFSPANPQGNEFLKKVLGKMSEMKLGFEIPIYNGNGTGPKQETATQPAPAAA